MKTLFLCFICAVVFVVGYFFGILHSIGPCEDATQIKKPYETLQIKDLEVTSPRYQALLLVIIFSSPGNHERRKIIRDTWLQTKADKDILHFFAIGSKLLNAEKIQSLEDENIKYKDLLMLDKVQDSFSKLSEKLREIFIWVEKNVSYTYVLKVDDDSFVHLDALNVALSQMPKSKTYWGYFDGQANVKKVGKWAERNWFLCDKYLPYAKGGGYVLSRDLVHQIVINAEYLSMYKNEDVSLGVWLAPFEINRLHDTRFDTEFMSRGCSNAFLVTHKQTVEMMIEKYQNIKRTEKLCSFEYQNRSNYTYNWSVLPSKCCIKD
ncbi:beta-1,3-galactosyltransferase 6-like [Uloborus diversus]|uniref:beta-1,3-galactosyltransferase 6-like n=1 Tax=Uloborus diversus TaxID=327109 RepID=UPI00240A4740|nr:beta-1,3-galactosyltransferase 6-like [Uloborus diversus]